MGMWKILLPYRYKFIRKRLGHLAAPRCLDIGCGNNSPMIMRHWFPQLRYDGIDIGPVDELGAAREHIDHYFQKNLDHDRLEDVPEQHYDAVVFSHVIEHLHYGLQALEEIATKVAPGGYIFVETPSLRTLALPHAKGFLHFHDDATHCKLYDVKDIANVLLAADFEIVRGGTRRDPVGVLVIGPLGLLFNIFYYLKTRRIYGLPLWDLLGVSSYVLARRVRSANVPVPQRN